MKITETLFKKRYRGERAFIPIKDIPVEFLASKNNIMIHVERGENGYNGWEEGETTLIISVEREQTELEKQEFKKQWDKLKAESKEKRRIEYLNLKKEFEHEEI